MPPKNDTGIKSSNDAVDQESAVASVGTATPPTPKAPAPASASDEPDEYPIDFEEWQAGQSALYRTHIAGYRNEVRLAGGLTVKTMRARWDHGFRVFLGEAKADDAPKV